MCSENRVAATDASLEFNPVARKLMDQHVDAIVENVLKILPEYQFSDWPLENRAFICKAMDCRAR